MDADLLIQHADRVYTCRGPAPRRGRDQREAGLIESASIAARHGTDRGNRTHP